MIVSRRIFSGVQSSISKPKVRENPDPYPPLIGEGRIQEDDIVGLLVPRQEKLHGLGLAFDAPLADRDVFQKGGKFGSIPLNAGYGPGSARRGLEGDGA